MKETPIEQQQTPTTHTMPTDIENRPITVIGAGTLGRQIAVMMADRGGLVRVYETLPDARAKAEEYIAIELPKVAATIDGGSVGTVEFTESLADAVKGAWLVIEAAPEKIELKKEIFATLDELAEPDAILASNSSSMPTSSFIDGVAHPERVLNLHFYQPPFLPGADLMSSGHTDPAVLELIEKQLPLHGVFPKTARKESTGFIMNRIWAAVKRESLNVVADGVSVPEDVDALWGHFFGHKIAPFEMMDKVGLDVVRDIERNYVEQFGHDDRPIRLLDEYIERGDLGVKTGRGFYDWSTGEPKPITD